MKQRSTNITGKVNWNDLTPVDWISHKVISFRRDNKLTAERFAVMANMSHASVLRIERGAHNISLLTAHSIARVMGITLSELLTPPSSAEAKAEKVRMINTKSAMTW